MATKGGGSLLGKADSTLASMSYREAMADVSPDLKSVYQDEVANQALFEKGIKDHFDGLHVKNTKLSDELDELLNTTVGEASNEENQTMYYNTINGLRDRLTKTKPTKEGDLERAKIRAEMSRLKENSASHDNTLIDLQTKVLNKDYNPDATGGPTLEFLKSIAGGKAKKEIIKGRIMYSLPGTDEKISEKDLQSMVASNDPKLNGEFNKVTASAGDRGKQAGAVWENEREGYVTDYMNSFTTKTGFGNHIHKRQGNLKYTYAQYLSGKGDGTENMKIWNTLKELGVNVPEDKNDDGKITEADFASKENGIALIESLTQINSGSFDFGIAKQAAAEFYTDNEAKREFDNGKSLRPPAPGSETDEDKNKFGLNLKKNYYTIQTSEGASYIDGQTISDTVETFKSVQDKGSGIFTGYDKVSHKLTNGKWFTWDDEAEDFTKEDNAQSIFTALGWDNNQQIMGYLSPRLDVNNDGTPDGPVSLDFLNKKYYDLIDKKDQ